VVIAVVIAVAGGGGDADLTATAPDTTRPTAATTAPSTTGRPATTTSVAATTTMPETTSPPTVVLPDWVGAVTATRDALAGLRAQDLVVAPVPYDRDDYDNGGWDDPDGDCRTIRHDILERDSLEPVTFDDTGCYVDAGHWIDAWSLQDLFTGQDSTIDHVVPLSNAHVMGAWNWDSDTKRRFANDTDPSALAVVSQATNSAKGNSTPDTWKPPQPVTWCRYAIDWIRTKARWGLAVTDTERTALDTMLDTCDQPDSLGPQPATIDTPIATAAVATTTPPPPATSPPPARPSTSRQTTAS